MNLKEVKLEKVAEITNGFSGADIRASVVESGMFAIREGRDHILQSDLMKGVLAYVIGLAVSIPFMNIYLGSFNYTFIFSKFLGGIDISYFIGFVVAGLVYYLTESRQRSYSSRLKVPNSKSSP